MKTLIVITLFAVTICSVVATSDAGVAFGPKVGYTKYSGDILPSSGDVGKALMYGAVLEITSFPLIDLEFNASYATKDFQYTMDIMGIPATTEFQFQDLSFLILAKKNLIPVPTSPLKLYIGGGFGWNLLSTEVVRVLADDVTLLDDPIGLLSNTVKMSGHGLFGVKIKPPAIPLAIYGETRFGAIFTEERIRTMQIEGGLLLGF